MNTLDFNKNAPPFILVVDDILKNLQVIGNILEEEDYEISVATCGEEALEMVEVEVPDLILLDTSMPVMNGWEVLERLRQNGEVGETPVIMVTARCEVQDINTASSYGISDYVAKPFDFAKLMEKISKALENKKVSSRA